MQLKRAFSACCVGLLVSTQGVQAKDDLPDGFLGWFVPAPQTCAAADVIGVSPDEIITVGGVQRILQVQRTDRFPRWVRVSLETVGGAGTEEVLIELGQDGLDLRVLFGDGSWLTWRRCL